MVHVLARCGAHAPAGQPANDLGGIELRGVAAHEMCAAQAEVLTGPFSVALLPLTLLASVFGMNVPLPGQPGSSTEFWVIVAIMAAVLATFVLFFRRRGYP